LSESKHVDQKREKEKKTYYYCNIILSHITYQDYCCPFQTIYCCWSFS